MNYYSYTIFVIVLVLIFGERAKTLKVKPQDVEEIQQISGKAIHSIDYFPGFNFSKVPKPDSSKTRCSFVQKVILAVIKEHLPLHYSNRTLNDGIEVSSDSIISFFRISGALFYHDIFSSKKYAEWKYSNSRTRCFVCGNMLPSSFGTYRNSKDQLVYGITSYDDALIGDYQLDIWRLAIALVNQASNMHYSRRAQEDLVNKFTRAYYKAIDTFSRSHQERELLFTPNNTYGTLHRFLAEAERHSGVHGKRSFINHMARGGRFHHARLLNNTKERKRIEKVWPSYIQRAAEQNDGYYKIKDIRRLHQPLDGYMVLVEGKTIKNYDDILLRVKRMHNPAWLSAAPKDVTNHIVNNYKNFAKRIITSNLALDIDVDPHLGWFKMGKDVYVVREYQAAHQTLRANEYIHRVSFQKLVQQWGTILATFHARSDNDFRKKFIGYSFEKNVVKVIGQRLDHWQKSVLRVAFGYHRQAISDYRCMRKYSRSFMGGKGLRKHRMRPHGPKFHHHNIHHHTRKRKRHLIHHHPHSHHIRHHLHHKPKHVHKSKRLFHVHKHKNRKFKYNKKTIRMSKNFRKMKKRLYKNAKKHLFGKRRKRSMHRKKKKKYKLGSHRQQSTKYQSKKSESAMDLNEDDMDENENLSSSNAQATD